jgi:D-glycero-alpha-D-manno-heptose-7-phosphate kinase
MIRRRKMIITRAPFRVSFCGGGSDLPSFYEQYGGCVLSTTIRKYMYLTIHNYFEKNQIVLKYSKTENVHDFSDIDHKIFKQCLSDFGLKGVEISSMADIPAGTGLGSSSTFTVALLHLLYTYTGQYVSKYKLAKEACEVEIEKLGEPIGKQDQFAAAFGGLKFYEFMPNGFVNVEPVIMAPESYKKLENNILMFYLGGTHSASAILKEQSKNVKTVDKAAVQKQMCDIARNLKEELQNNNVDAMGELLHKNWILKRSLASGITNSLIDETYDKAMMAGATGGKLLGAGGAGFMIFYVPEEKHESVRTALSHLREMEFEMDNSGASIVMTDKDFA